MLQMCKAAVLQSIQHIVVSSVAGVHEHPAPELLVKVEEVVGRPSYTPLVHAAVQDPSGLTPMCQQPCGLGDSIKHTSPLLPVRAGCLDCRGQLCTELEKQDLVGSQRFLWIVSLKPSQGKSCPTQQSMISGLHVCLVCDSRLLKLRA